MFQFQACAKKVPNARCARLYGVHCETIGRRKTGMNEHTSMTARTTMTTDTVITVCLSMPPLAACRKVFNKNQRTLVRTISVPRSPPRESPRLVGWDKSWGRSASIIFAFLREATSACQGPGHREPVKAESCVSSYTHIRLAWALLSFAMDPRTERRASFFLFARICARNQLPLFRRRDA
jgi:hypothetical protein